MNFPPTIKQLKYLVALKKHLHFGKAADACNVTQSTLSAGLQELETLLGVQLVERTKRSVMFTGLGDEVAQRAQKVLNDVEDITALAEAAQDPSSGTVRMGIIPTIAPFLLPRMMPVLRDAMPHLTLHLVEDKSAVLCEKLRSGELDLVLYALPFTCGDTVELPLFKDPFFAAYPDTAAPKGPISGDTLSKEHLMLLEEGHCLRDHALEACQLMGRRTRAALSATSLHTIIEMVAAGQGVTLLPGMAVDAGLVRQHSITVVPFSDIRPTRTIGLIWRASNPRQETYEAIGKVIQEARPASSQVIDTQ